MRYFVTGGCLLAAFMLAGCDKVQEIEEQITGKGKESKDDDSYIRKAAVKYRVPYITTTAAATAAARGIARRKREPAAVKSLQSYHADIK